MTHQKFYSLLQNLEAHEHTNLAAYIRKTHEKDDEGLYFSPRRVAMLLYKFSRPGLMAMNVQSMSADRNTLVEIANGDYRFIHQNDFIMDAMKESFLVLHRVLLGVEDDEEETLLQKLLQRIMICINAAYPFDDPNVFPTPQG